MSIINWLSESIGSTNYSFISVYKTGSESHTHPKFRSFSPFFFFSRKCWTGLDVGSCLPSLTQMSSVSRFLCFTQNVNMIFSSTRGKGKRFSLSEASKSPTRLFFYHHVYQPSNYCTRTTDLISPDRAFMGKKSQASACWCVLLTKMMLNWNANCIFQLVGVRKKKKKIQQELSYLVRSLTNPWGKAA